MKIASNHLIDSPGVIFDILPGGTSMPTRRFLVIHYTAGATAKSSIEWWKRPAAKGANAHLVIDRDGTIYQCRPFDRTAGHAGASQWKDPKTGVTYRMLNQCSIGIELANAGDNWQLAERYTKLPPVVARHKFGGPEKKWEAYPAEQMDALRRVSAALVIRYNLDDVVGHEDIAPTRKVDPGPAFPMAEFRMFLGFPAGISRLT
jgi:N-acetylmuramoyl-L-alanine amidase